MYTSTKESPGKGKLVSQDELPVAWGVFAGLAVIRLEGFKPRVQIHGTSHTMQRKERGTPTLLIALHLFIIS